MLGLDQVPEPKMLNTLIDRLDELLWRKDFEFCEIISGLAAFGWGVWLLMPWATFATAKSFDVLQLIAPEWAWGILLGWIGFTQIGALMLDHQRPRRWSSMGATMAWAFIAGTIGLSSWQSTGVVVYMVLSLTAAIAYLRIRRLSG